MVCIVDSYIFKFLSEESRRQSKILYETLNPAWNECFFYYGVTAGDLGKRALEVGPFLWLFSPRLF